MLRLKFTNYDIKDSLKIVLIIFLIAHVFYFGLFLSLGIINLALLNVFSVLAYICAINLLKNPDAMDRSIIIMQLEIFIHAFVCALVLGWDYGFQNIILGFMSTMFFVSAKNKFIGFLFIFAQGAAYLFLYFYFRHIPHAGGEWAQTFYVLNFTLVAIGLIVFCVLLRISNTLKFYDILSQKEQLKEMASHDPLTGLLNRRAMQNIMDRDLIDGSEHLSLVLCDIDDFKRINDEYGHNAGDEVLVGVAEILGSSFRDKDYVCRWGGEEFLAILTNINLDNSRAVFERIRAQISGKSFKIDGKNISVTMTFGLVNIRSGDKVNFKAMIRQADELLYKGKSSGKNCVISGTLRSS